MEAHRNSQRNTRKVVIKENRMSLDVDVADAMIGERAPRDGWRRRHNVHLFVRSSIQLAHVAKALTSCTAGCSGESAGSGLRRAELT
jgi:hypothetical protein